MAPRKITPQTSAPVIAGPTAEQETVVASREAIVAKPSGIQWYVRTYSGEPFFYGDMNRNVFRIDDIAKQLARINRFLGATKFPYSVAQHSWCVAQEMMRRTGGDKAAGLIGLLHDVHEFVVCDIPTPLKKHMKEMGFDFNTMIAGPIDEWVYALHGVRKADLPHFHKLKDEIDAEMSWQEGKQLIRGYQIPDGVDATFNFQANSQTIDFAERNFIMLYRSLVPHVLAPMAEKVT